MEHEGQLYDFLVLMEFVDLMDLVDLGVEGVGEHVQRHAAVVKRQRQSHGGRHGLLLGVEQNCLRRIAVQRQDSVAIWQ